MMETMLRSILGRMNGTYWSQLKVQLAILMMIACLVDVCSAAPYHERAEDHHFRNKLLKGLTYATHIIHFLFAIASAQARPGSGDDKCRVVFAHICFWVVGHTTVHHSTDIEQVFEEHWRHGKIRAAYSVVLMFIAICN